MTTLTVRGVGGVHRSRRAAGLAMLLILCKHLLMRRQGSPNKAVNRVKEMCL